MTAASLDEAQAVFDRMARTEGRVDSLLVDRRVLPAGSPGVTPWRSALSGGPRSRSLLTTTTGHAAARDAARALGFDDALGKPVLLSQLLTKLGWARGKDALRDADAPLAAAESRLRAAYRGMRVLLAEDNPINQDVALDLLTSVGLDVEVADDGAAAVRRVEQGTYALVLMDMQMPVMDGLDATRAIRRMPGRESLPIIAIISRLMRASIHRNDGHAVVRQNEVGRRRAVFRPDVVVDFVDVLLVVHDRKLGFCRARYPAQIRAHAMLFDEAHPRRPRRVHDVDGGVLRRVLLALPRPHVLRCFGGHPGERGELGNAERSARPHGRY